MFVLGSYITIGKYYMKPHDVRVQKSIYEYVDKATIKLPISARLININRTTESSIIKTVQTAQQFQQGDFVSIKLAYNGSLNTEFEGGRHAARVRKL